MAMTPVVTSRRSLIALLQRTSELEVAARCGVKQPRVSNWVSGLTTPSAESRERLWSIYGISPDRWGRSAISVRCVRHTV
jgi:transcriptional regulator with XRE-family HTH domain